MYYHILVETQVGSINHKYFEFDFNDLEEIKKYIVSPFLEGKQFQVDGYFINPSIVVRMLIKQSEISASEAADKENYSPTGESLVWYKREDAFFNDNYMKDITRQILS